MNDANLSLTHRLAELHTVATDLRAARTARATAPSRAPNHVRLVAGRALVGLGARLMGEALPVRTPDRARLRMAAR